jgi:hypothetical protein
MAASVLLSLLAGFRSVTASTPRTIVPDTPRELCFCSPDNLAGLSWPSGTCGNTVQIRCPGQARGVIARACDEEVMKPPYRHVSSNCVHI